MESALPVSAPFNARFLSHILAIIALAGLAGCGGEPDSVITTSDGNTMILIPAGTFPRGGTEEEVSEVPDKQYISYYAERPISDISLRSFYIDKFEVTTAQYREFLEDTGDGATRWDHADQPEGMNHATRYVTENLAGDVQPAVGINWYDAYAYCGWADKRLPSEAEWEYAARGSTYRIYPWGDHGPHHDDIYFANYRPKAGADADGHRMTAPIGTYPDGVSPFGIMDMAGNAEEWVQDWYDIRYFASSKGLANPPGPAEGQQRVIKGGSYGVSDWEVRIAQRFKGKPHNKGPRIGFRCVRDL